VRVTAAIALSVFRESVRDKVLYNLVFFALLLMASSFLIGQLTAGQDVKIIKDLGLSAISLFGHFIAIFIGIGLVSKEVERRSIYALLAKPMSRTELLVGKFFGLLSTLTVNVSVDDDLCIEVIDDGKGIAVDVTPSGLSNLRQRAEDAGGSFSVDAMPAGGTKLRWCAPLP
jgi:hypothetical protein